MFGIVLQTPLVEDLLGAKELLQGDDPLEGLWGSDPLFGWIGPARRFELLARPVVEQGPNVSLILQSGDNRFGTPAFAAR